MDSAQGLSYALNSGFRALDHSFRALTPNFRAQTFVYGYLSKHRVAARLSSLFSKASNGSFFTRA
jgi:hypothetical protein